MTFEVLNGEPTGRIVPESFSIRANLYIYREVYLITETLNALQESLKKLQTNLDSLLQEENKD